MTYKVPTLEEQNAEIRAECQRLADFLVAKNTAYGGQALAPIAIVSKGDPLDIIFARMDDKLSRILRGQAAGEDPWQDLRGYITLWQVVNAFKAKGFYSKEPKVEKKEEVVVVNTSPLPMPIDQRYQAPKNPIGSVEMTFEEPADGEGTPGHNGSLVISDTDDPTDLPVADIEAITSQNVSSLQPAVPEKFSEVAKPDAGSQVNAEDDPWVAMQRPTRRKASGGVPLNPGNQP